MHKIYTQTNNELLADTLRDCDMIDAVTPSIPTDAVIADAPLPTKQANQAYQVSGNRNTDGYYTVSNNVSVVADYRNVDTYNTSTGEKEAVAELGDLPNHLSTEPRPSEYHTWGGTKWALKAADKARKLQDEQAQAWVNIKAKREQNRYGGIEVAGKWYHTDDSSRLQYLTLSGLPQLPANLQWKTMDNSFVAMTKELVAQIVAAAIAAEQADFANAETHRLAMLQSNNPLDYDYSGGWSACYGG